MKGDGRPATLMNPLESCGSEKRSTLREGFARGRVAMAEAGSLRGDSTLGVTDAGATARYAYVNACKYQGSQVEGVIAVDSYLGSGSSIVPVCCKRVPAARLRGLAFPG